VFPQRTWSPRQTITIPQDIAKIVVLQVYLSVSNKSFYMWDCRTHPMETTSMFGFSCK